MYKALYKTYYRIEPADKYLVQMQSQMRATGVNLPEVHGTRKTKVTNTPVEKQKPQIKEKQVDKKRPKLGRGRAGMQCKHPQPVADTLVSANKLPKILIDQKVTIDSTKFPVPNQIIMHNAETITRRQVQDKNREQPFQPDPYFRPPQRPPDNLQPESPKTNTVTKTNIDIDFEETSPHQEGIISELNQRPDKTYFQEPKDLESLVNTNNLIQNFLTKQEDIDKILKIIQCKVLKGLHLSVMIKEIQAGYLNSLYFKETYLYLAHNKLPSSKVGIRKVEALAEKYILLDSLLFKISITPDKEMAVLAILETCVDSIMAQYHSSLFAGHQGVIKTYLTISDKFFIPNPIHYLRSYIKGCHICQLTRNEKPPSRQLQTRLNLNYRPLSRLSMDLKVMPKSSKGHKFILCIIDKITN